MTYNVFGGTLNQSISKLLLLCLADHRHDRREDEGRYAGVCRETLLNGVCHSAMYYCRHNYH